MRAFVWLAALLLASPLFAQTATISKLATLAEHPVWLELLHYEKPLLGQARSAIHSKEFFLTATGATDPLAELHATLKALQGTDTGEPDSHPACRFPARAQWLASQLPALHLPEPDCPSLTEWTRGQSVASVSVIFATGFLDNPASYYGHTLLKLNEADDQRDSLLDRSVNYGAILEGRIDPLSYVIKGIVGGYDGGFSDIEYYFHNHNYGEAELRDLWEYQLDLSADDTRLIVNHAWEVLGKRYTYYFFRRNCAFRMAELLQLASSVEVTPANRPWTIPQSLIQHFDEQGRHGATVAAIRYHPSRQSRLYYRFAQLNREERRALRGLVDQQAFFETEQFRTLSVASQQAVVETALDYYQFVIRTEAEDPQILQERYRLALARRYQLPPGNPSGEVAAPPSPHTGRRPGWAQASAVSTSSHGSAAQIRLRAAYYDALDGESGHVPNAGLTMGDVTLRLGEHGLRVRRAVLFAIENLNPGVTGLPGDRGSAWNLGAGLESLRLDCDSCLVPRLHGDMGLARRVHHNIVAAGYAGGAVQENRLGYGHGFVRAGSRIVYRHGPWAARSVLEWRVPVDGERSPHAVGELEVRRALSANSDIRLHIEHNGGSQIGAGLGWYW